MTGIQPGKTKLSNATVEGYFNIINHEVFKSKTHNPIGYFAETIKHYVKEQCARIKMAEIQDEQRNRVYWLNETATASWKPENKKTLNHMLFV